MVLDKFKMDYEEEVTKLEKTYKTVLQRVLDKLKHLREKYKIEI